MQFYKSGKVRDAISIAQKAVALDSNISYYYAFLGNAYSNLDQLDSAQHYYQKALDLKQDDIDALNGLSAIFAKKGLFNAAIEHLKLAIAFNPEDYRTYINLSKTVLGEKDQSKHEEHLLYAKQCLEKAIQLNRHAAQAYSYLGQIYLQLSNYREAIAYLEEALRLKDMHNTFDVSATHYSLAGAYYHTMQYDLAIKNCQEALEFIPNASDVLFLLGLSYSASGDKRNALIQCKKLSRFNPDAGDILRELIRKSK